MWSTELPSLAAIRAFAVAGRHENMRDAAKELGVTPSAVSHQVSALEAWVGAPLFDRAVRKVTLTSLGKALAVAIDAHFDDIFLALSQARGAAGDTRIRVSALPLFTNTWLVPRLVNFQAANPGLSIEIETKNALADLAREGVDVAIRNIEAPTPGLIAHKLLDLRAVVLCSRELCATIRGPADLCNVPLIHNSARGDAWKRWFERMGMSDTEPAASLSFDTVPSALEAASQGRGVVLGLAPLVFESTAAAGLVVPFDAPHPEAGTYYVVYRREDRARRAVRAFVDWLRNEMRKDHRRLALNAKVRSTPVHGH